MKTLESASKIANAAKTALVRKIALAKQKNATKIATALAKLAKQKIAVVAKTKPTT